jgi:hypothetical protein
MDRKFALIVHTLEVAGQLSYAEFLALSQGLAYELAGIVQGEAREVFLRFANEPKPGDVEQLLPACARVMLERKGEPRRQAYYLRSLAKAFLGPTRHATKKPALQ